MATQSKKYHFPQSKLDMVKNCFYLVRYVAKTNILCIMKIICSGVPNVVPSTPTKEFRIQQKVVKPIWNIRWNALQCVVV